jgi:hypothetical protein
MDADGHGSGREEAFTAENAVNAEGEREEDDASGSDEAAQTRTPSRSTGILPVSDPAPRGTGIVPVLDPAPATAAALTATGSDKPAGAPAAGQDASGTPQLDAAPNERQVPTREPNAENRDPNPARRLLALERARADRDIDDALRLGKFTRPAADALRRLLGAGLVARYALDTADGEHLDLAALARDIIDGTPPGAAVDMTEHTRVFPVPPPDAGMNDAKAARLARENKALANVL